MNQQIENVYMSSKIMDCQHNTVLCTVEMHHKRKIEGGGGGGTQRGGQGVQNSSPEEDMV